MRIILQAINCFVRALVFKNKKISYNFYIEINYTRGNNERGSLEKEINQGTINEDGGDE